MTHKEVIAALRSTPSRSKRELFDTAADMIERLVDKPVVSNADRIRAMSDEELAKWLSICGCPDAFSMVGDCESGKCEDCWIEYLQQPSDHAEVASEHLMRPNGEEDA